MPYLLILKMNCGVDFQKIPGVRTEKSFFRAWKLEFYVPEPSLVLLQNLYETAGIRQHKRGSFQQKLTNFDYTEFSINFCSFEFIQMQACISFSATRYYLLSTKHYKNSKSYFIIMQFHEKLLHQFENQIIVQFCM